MTTSSTERLLSDILARHPNELALSLSTHGPSTVPSSFDSWWSWASDPTHTWQSILDGTVHDLPVELHQLLEHINDHSLDRTPISLQSPPNTRVIGLSPKKYHEVHRMTSYISSLLPSPEDVWIVDVGSGQGYLTRSLLAQLNPQRILALDRNPLQTSGAQTWTSKQGNKKQSTLDMDKIEYRTMDIDQHNLLDTVDEWVMSHGGQDVKVLFVALHACGSLTLDIVRAFAQRRNKGEKGWKPMGVVVVGCCYNLLRPSDYPLCPTTQPRTLPPSAYHLASQVPSTWTDAHELSMQKLVWRALLGPLIPASASITPNTMIPMVQQPTISHTENNNELGMTTTNVILGKLPKSAYTSWHSFLLSAFTKLKLPVPPNTEKSDELENQLAILNLLRCMAGPYVESLLLRDRLAYIQDLVGQDRWKVDMVPLFDQAEASARNMSISIFPVK